MYASMHLRLAAIASDDSDREEQLGVACPIKLGLYLSGGHEVQNCWLADGENSLDDASIDVMVGEPPVLRVIAIAHIVMVRVAYPSTADEEHAQAAAALGQTRGQG